MERVRFAPSPTGPLHIGGLRTALFNYLYTKKSKGSFVLRIEDTDKNRKIKGSEKHIIDSLKWCGLIHDEGPDKGGAYGPYRQSERISIYKQYIKFLLEKGKAYYAFDSTEALSDLRSKCEKEGKRFNYGLTNRATLKNSLTMPSEELKALMKDKEPYVIRLKIDDGNSIVCSDLLRGPVSFKRKELEDKILIKEDGFPTYHFANVVDDYLMKITTVIRGEEWLSSLPIHYILYKSFNWTPPKFLHLPLILNPSGKGKLSKRDSDKNGYPIFPLKWDYNEEAIEGFKDKGFLNEALINYISQLGWSFSEKKEIYKLEELIALFSIEKIQKGGCRFDFEKAKWVNSKHLQLLTSKEILEVSSANLKEKFLDYKKDSVGKMIELVKNRLVLITDLEELVSVFIKNPKDFNEKDFNKMNKLGAKKILQELIALISLTKNKIQKKTLIQYSETQQINLGRIMQLMRLALVGSLTGPDIIAVVEVVGINVTLQRLKFLTQKL